jgi:putative inorganic carbon (hco3(-)) transporter
MWRNQEPSKFIFGIFLTFVVARYMQWGARRSIFETIRIEFVLGLILTIVCAVIISKKPIDISRAKNVVSGIALLFVAMLIQLPFAADPEMANHIFVDRVIKFAMLTFFMAALIRTPKSLGLFLAAFLFACFYVTQESARGAITGGLVWENQGVMRLHGAVPIYRHPNSLAGIAMGTIPFCIFLWPAIQRRWVKLLLIPPLITSFICVLYSGSRTAYIAFFAFMVYWFWQSQNKKKWVMWTVLIAIAVGPFIPEQYIGRFKSIGGQEAQGNSKEKRIEILEDAWLVLKAYPLGVGVASFPAVREEMFGRKQDTHNLYLEVATNLGVQGFAVFAFLIGAFISTWAMLKRFSKKLNLVLLRQPDSVDKRIIRELFYKLKLCEQTTIAIGGFLFVRLTLGFFGMDLYEVYWWFIAGTLLSLNTVYLSIASKARAAGLLD